MSTTKRTATQRAALTALALLLSIAGVFAAQPTATASSSTRSASRSSAKAATTVLVRGCAPGSRTLGAYYADSSVRVYACGIRPSWDGARTGGGAVVRPYGGSNIYYRGYQCIELVARFLKVRYNADAGVANGAQAVDRYAAAYPTRFVKIANGTRGMAPRAGDVLSLSHNKYFNDVGHTGVVLSSSVNRAGNGSIRSLEQNWGGTGGTSGYHVYTVKSWRVIYTGLPHIKWLRAR